MQPEITIFTTPKPFEGHTATIQRNAIKSWTLLEPKPEVIIFGDEPGAEEAASDLGATFGGEVARNECGTPLVNDIFARAQAMASHETLCYVNADIILFDDIMEAIGRVSNILEFLMIGRRWDMDIVKPLDFDEGGWQERLKAEVRESCELQCIYRIDYFAFNRGLYTGIPPLALGRMYWDSTLIYQARKKGALVIDSTESVTALHQNHDYAHAGVSSVFDVLRTPEAKRNMRLAGGIGQSFSAMSANRLLGDNGLRKQPWRHYLSLGGIKPFLVLNPVAGFFFRPAWRMYDVVYYWRISRK